MKIHYKEVTPPIDSVEVESFFSTPFLKLELSGGRILAYWKSVDGRYEENSIYQVTFEELRIALDTLEFQ